MKNKCERAIAAYGMLSRGDTVVVAVSGGADSMALLHYLFTHKEYYDIQVIAAHFNHSIRYAEADRDENAVRAFCEKYSVPFVSKKTDVPSLATEKHIGLEECSRELRYEFLQSVAKGAKIATAHTNSDSCESFLFNFARGTGMKGLRGIPAVRDNIIRPCILCSSQDTRSYCVENHIPWCEDSTNKDDAYARNHIRLNVIPALKTVNVAFENNALRCMQLMQTDYEFLSKCAEEAFSDCKIDATGIDFDNLKKSCHDAIINRVLYIFAQECGCKEISLKHISFLRNLKENESITLSDSICFVLQNGVLKKTDRSVDVQNVCLAVAEHCHSYSFFDTAVHIEFFASENEFNKKYTDLIDADKTSDIVLRNRLPGDKLRIKRRKCTKSLKQLFSENEISTEQRKKWPILADDKGVIWVAGFGVDESRLPDKNSKNFIKIEWSKCL